MEGMIRSYDHAKLVGPSPSRLRVRKLEAECRDSDFCQSLRDPLQEGVAHVRTGAVREHVQHPRTLRTEQERIQAIRARLKSQLIHAASSRAAPAPSRRRHRRRGWARADRA